MLEALLSRGLTQGQIASEIGDSQTNVCRWSKGKVEPRYSKGKRIERLYHSSFLCESVSTNANMH